MRETHGSEAPFQGLEIKVISLGGSLVNPGKINFGFLKKFRKLIFDLTEQFKFLIVAGGGEPARNYQEALRELGIQDQQLLDWVGISATHLNAKLVQLAFGPKSSEKILTKLKQKIDFNQKDILIGAGVRPGWSTDFDSFYWARRLGANQVVNATNVDYVYDRPPREAGARPLKKLTWQEYLKIIDSQWKAGAKLPLDPVAARFARRYKMKGLVVKGSNLSELKKAILGQPFKGTILG